MAQPLPGSGMDAAAPSPDGNQRIMWQRKKSKMDKEQQREESVLTALDNNKTQGYHFLAVLIAGMGFFTDAYDLFSISVVTKLLGRIYYTQPGSNAPGTLPPGISGALNAVALVGALCGQVFFGYLGDVMGRKKVYGYTASLMIVAALAQGFSFSHSTGGVISSLCIFRFCLGFGIGGDYPLSAVIMSEYANKRTRGAFIALIFSAQGIGLLSAATVGIVVSSIFKLPGYPPFNVDAAGSCPAAADYVWRIILMLGALPAALTLYLRLKMPETPRYTALVENNAKKAAMDMRKVAGLSVNYDDVSTPESSTKEAVAVEGAPRKAAYGLWSREFRIKWGLILLGTSTTWFLLDIAFYSQNLYQNVIYSAIGWVPKASHMGCIEEVFKISRAQALVALAGTVPGYYVTVLLVDIWGRKYIQLQGFLVSSVFLGVLAGLYHKIANHSHAAEFVFFYGITFFFYNFGPNATTFILPAELFPTRLRGTCHGISAACGKAGAIVGAFGILYASQDPHHPNKGYPKGIGVAGALWVLFAVNILGFFFTFLVPETKGKSLEELAGEFDEDPADGTNNEGPMGPTANEPVVVPV